MPKAFIIGLFLAMTSCGVTERQTPQVDVEFRSTDTVITAEELHDIYVAYKSTNVVLNKTISRADPNWQTENLLPKISSWFQVGRGLTSAQHISSEVSLYVLAPLPEKLLLALKTSLGEIDTHLAILKFSFWRKIAEAQKLGLQIGFMASSSQIEALGVYYESYKIIGLSSVGEENTLDHELRHHEQYSHIDRNAKLVAIDQACIPTVNTAFGEIDATEIELPAYLGIENYMDHWLPLVGTAVDPNLFSSSTHSEQALLTINLEYPYTVAHKVVVQDSCPEELRQAMKKLESHFAAAMVELPKALADAAGTVARIDTDERAFKHSHCGLQSNPLCERIQGRIQANRGSYEGFKQIFRDRIQKEITERRSFISNVVRELSHPIRKDLCHHAIGFAKFFSCD